MSYILQALKKAEEARGATPAAVAMPGAPPPMSRPRWQWIAGGVAGVAGIGVAVALWALGPGAGDAPAGRSQNPPARAALDATEPVVAAPAATTPFAAAPAADAPGATTPPAAAHDSRAVAATDPRAVAPAADTATRPQAPARGMERASAADRRIARAADPLPAASSRPERTPMRATTRAPVAPPQSPATSPAERAVAAVAPRPTAARPLAPQTAAGQTAAPHAVPSPAASPRAAPSQAAPSQAAVPEAAIPPRAAPSASASHTPPVSELRTLMAKLSLQVLSFSAEPRDRFVFVNGRKYVEGQSIDDKLLIERITDGGVLLSYRGERATLTSP